MVDIWLSKLPNIITLQIEHGNLRSSSDGYFFHAVIQHICGIFCFREASWDDSKIFSESSKMMIRFPCQRVTILEEFVYFQIALTIHSFQASCAPILFFKNFKNSHLSWISNFHALYAKNFHSRLRNLMTKWNWKVLKDVNGNLFTVAHSY